MPFPSLGQQGPPNQKAWSDLGPAQLKVPPSEKQALAGVISFLALADLRTDECSQLAMSAVNWRSAWATKGRRPESCRCHDGLHGNGIKGEARPASRVHLHSLMSNGPPSRGLTLKLCTADFRIVWSGPGKRLTRPSIYQNCLERSVRSIEHGRHYFSTDLKPTSPIPSCCSSLNLRKLRNIGGGKGKTMRRPGNFNLGGVLP